MKYKCDTCRWKTKRLVKGSRAEWYNECKAFPSFNFDKLRYEKKDECEYYEKEE